MQEPLADELRMIFAAPDRGEAERYLKLTGDHYSKDFPVQSDWLEANVLESLTVFDLPKKHWRKLRTSNMAERQMQEIKRRTRVARIFPKKEALNRLAASVLMVRN